MNYYQQGFKQDILNTIFKLTGKFWLKITGGYAIQMLITASLFALVFTSSVLDKEAFLTSITSVQTPQEMMVVYEELFNSILSNSTLMTALVVLFAVLLVLYAWSVNFQVLLADEQIRRDNADFVGILKKSVNKDVFKIIGAILSMYVIFSLLVGVVSMVAKFSGFLMFILLLTVIAFVLRLVLLVPAMVVGKRTFSESLLWSLKHMSWLRGIKMLGIGVLAGFILIIAVAIVGMVSTIFAAIPILGPILQFAVNLFLGGIMSALMTSAFMGLYYRYEDDLSVDNPQDDIDIDNLLISE